MFFKDILERKNASLGFKNKKFKKSKNSLFSKRILKPLVLVHKWPFFQLFFEGNIGQENVFSDILERKNAFQGYKNKKLKKSKVDIFPRGITHGSGPKLAIFPTFFFRQYMPGKYLLRYSKTKKRLSRL